MGLQYNTSIMKVIVIMNVSLSILASLTGPTDEFGLKWMNAWSKAVRAEMYPLSSLEFWPPTILEGDLFIVNV